MKLENFSNTELSQTLPLLIQLNPIEEQYSSGGHYYVGIASYPIGFTTLSSSGTLAIAPVIETPKPPISFTEEDLIKYLQQVLGM